MRIIHICQSPYHFKVPLIFFSSTIHQGFLNQVYEIHLPRQQLKVCRTEYIYANQRGKVTQLGSHFWLKDSLLNEHQMEQNPLMKYIPDLFSLLYCTFQVLCTLLNWHQLNSQGLHHPKLQVSHNMPQVHTSS